MLRKALFPISMSNQHFSTTNTKEALKGIFEQFDEWIFLIADQLQFYNRAYRVAEGASLQRLLLDMRPSSQFSNQRRRWLQKVKVRLGEIAQQHRWRILSVDELADSQCYAILRNVTIAFHTVDVLHQDIIEAAAEHTRQRQHVRFVDCMERLSLAYILEEIALSIRLRVIEKVEAEFYMGEYLKPVLRLYRNQYPIDVFSLAGQQEEETRFDFYDFKEVEGRISWTLSRNA